MAENTLSRNNCLGATPIYGLPYTITYPFLDADGDLVSAATTPDAEVSKNGDTFADCTNESTEIATNSGIYYLNLTATEMTADIVAVQAKSATSGMKTTVAILYPVKLPTFYSGTANDDGSGTSSIVLDANASAIDDFYNGMLVSAVIDSVTEVRMITDYNGSTKAASVSPDFNTAPDNTDTFTIYLPPGATHIQQANVSHAANVAWASGAITASVVATGAIDADAIADNAIDAGAIAADAITAAKIATGAITAAKFAAGAIDAAAIADNAIDAGAIASDAITAAKIANDAIDASAIATGAITAAKFAAGAIDAAALAADAGTEIATAVWASGTRSLTELDEDSTTIDIDTAVWGGGTRTLTALDEDSTTLDLDATIRAAVGLASANLDTQLDALPTNAELSTALGTADDAVLAQIALVRAKTDSLTFTTAGQVDANIQYVNDVQVSGTGAAGDEWGPT